MHISEEEFRLTTRIIDASPDRIGEGLRFLEEITSGIPGVIMLTEWSPACCHDIPERLPTQ